MFHVTYSFEPEPLGSIDGEADVGLTDIVEAEFLIEQPYEGADCAGCIVVLGFAEKKGTTSFKIPQIDIIAESITSNLALGINCQYDFRFRIVPV